jgi:hypothetical protein
MTVTHNIDVVMRRLKGIEKNIPLAAARAAARPTWRDEAAALARKTLIVLATPHQRRFAEAFADTVLAFPQVMGFKLTMDAAHRDMVLTDDARTFGIFKMFEANTADYKQLILEWVQTDPDEGGKRKDKRDWTKTDLQVANFMAHLMLTPSARMSWAEQVARDKLQPHIDAYIQKRMQGNIDAATVNMWLTAVMKVWKDWLMVAYPEALKEELSKV